VNPYSGDTPRARLAEALPVGAGVALIALSAYAVLAMAGHVLAPAQYAAVASLYLLMSVLGPGIFVAVEQQTTHEVSARIAAGSGWAPALRSGALASARLAGVVTLLVLGLSPLLVPRVFGGSWLLVGGAVLAVWGAAASYPLRGVYAGRRRYGWYGSCMALEGLGRAGAAAVLVGFGVSGGGWYGLVFGFGLVLSAVVTTFGPRTGGPGPELPVGGLVGRRFGGRSGDRSSRRFGGGMFGRIAVLACGCGLTLVIANLGPVVLTYRLGPSDPVDPALSTVGSAGDIATAASFVSLFVLARIPVLLATPVQAMLLSRLTACAQRGEYYELRRVVRLALLAVAALGVPGVIGGALLGPWAAQVFFHAPLRLTSSVAGLLAVGTVAMVAAQLLQPALVALGRNRAASTAWAIGTAVFAALLALPGYPLAGCITAQVAAPLVVAAVMLWSLRVALAGVSTPVAVGTGEV
jgi:O-antigen/teichoic acid export membrane protein